MEIVDQGVQNDFCEKYFFQVKITYNNNNNNNNNKKNMIGIVNYGAAEWANGHLDGF